MNKLAFQCAGAMVPCKCCQGTGGHEGYEAEGAEHGWVYMLPDEVRIRCVYHFQHRDSKCPGKISGVDMARDSTNSCRGLGWTPATDGWEEAVVTAGATVCGVWWNSLERQWSGQVSFKGSYENSYPLVQVRWNKNRKVAFFQALHAALTAMGARFQEGDAHGE